jgi:hypothetical protein
VKWLHAEHKRSRSREIYPVASASPQTDSWATILPRHSTAYSPHTGRKNHRVVLPRLPGELPVSQKLLAETLTSRTATNPGANKNKTSTPQPQRLKKTRAFIHRMHGLSAPATQAPPRFTSNCMQRFPEVARQLARAIRIICQGPLRLIRSRGLSQPVLATPNSNQVQFRLPLADLGSSSQSQSHSLLTPLPSSSDAYPPTNGRLRVLHSAWPPRSQVPDRHGICQNRPCQDGE